MKYFAAFVVLLWSGLMLAALPGSGAISFSDIQTEFGGSNPISFSEYYRNGTYVPTNATTGSIATSGAINVDSFHGAAASVAPTLSASGTAGTDGANVRGYESGGFGTLSPTTTSDSKTIVTVNYNNLTIRSFIEVSGFSSDPGQTGWTSQFTINGGVRTTAGASNYSYAAGTATWRYDNPNHFVLTNGVAYTFTIP